MTIQLDIFKTQTFDGYPVEVECVIGSDVARVYIPGIIKARVHANLPKDKALALYNNVSVITYNELRKAVEFN